MDLTNSNRILPAAGVRRNSESPVNTGRLLVGTRQNEGSPPNPLRRGLPDNSVRSDALLHCKKTIQIATFNTNTIRTDGRANELAHCFVKNNIDVMGIQEHRRVHNDTLVFQRIEGQHLITSSAWRNNAQAATGGVGMMLSPKARRALRSVKSHAC